MRCGLKARLSSFLSIGTEVVMKVNPTLFINFLADDRRLSGKYRCWVQSGVKTESQAPVLPSDPFKAFNAEHNILAKKPNTVSTPRQLSRFETKPLRRLLFVPMRSTNQHLCHYLITTWAANYLYLVSDVNCFVRRIASSKNQTNVSALKLTQV